MKSKTTAQTTANSKNATRSRAIKRRRTGLALCLQPHRQLKNSVIFLNDPSAGSPTETLLRLLVPLNDQVWLASPLWKRVAPPSKQIRKPH